jgi:hypothetical protein
MRDYLINRSRKEIMQASRYDVTTYIRDAIRFNGWKITDVIDVMSSEDISLTDLVEEEGFRIVPP